MKKLLTILLILITCIFADKYKVSVDDISQYKVDYKILNPCAVSNDASYFFATERVYDVKKIARGNAYDLIIFRFKDKKLETIDRIPLKIYHLVNVAYDSDRHRIFIVGNRGNKIIRVDPRNNRKKVEFEYQQGQKGFKAGPFVFCHKSKLYATGWFYDEEQNWLGDYVARIAFTKKGVRFQRKASLDYLFKYRFSNRGTVRTNFYVSGDLFYFSLIDQVEKKTFLMELRNKKLTPVDKEHIISTFAATDERIFYITRDADGHYHHFLKNFTTGEKYTIGRENDRFTYPFLVKDRLVVLKTDLKRKTFNAYVGIEKDRYLLQRFIKNETLGAMKISQNAKYYLFMGIDGITIGTLVRNESTE
ncbi:hypothetical protein [Candidatus Uabimicrobium amorphum]|uniref:Uncharacterized protein n=1 Tax=Uabimicrobium amorphum TaxID=2596890 RepID=A0A5S9IU16_UABAM|nr:hypothetical protein [Candidatus Uabimicrobium amorphum]BBM88133.1 hypothetical protein UABAM_06549 [Candidatus Uabimicrobium amorphum]